MLTDKGGDNAQVQAVADLAASRLGWQIEAVPISFRPPWNKKKPRVVARIDHLNSACRHLLRPPWPDIVITTGRRPACVAKWIRSQSRTQVRIVLVNKPTAEPGFDWKDYELILLSRVHSGPRLPNMMKLDLPLIYVNAEQLAQARAFWADRFRLLPKPLVGVLVGGETRPYRFDSRVFTALLNRARHIRQLGGTPVVSVSRRTPDWLVNRLKEEPSLDLIEPSGGSEPSAHLALMAEADSLAVTEDSISMLVESVRLGKPLSIIELPRQRWLQVRMAAQRLVHSLVNRALPGAGHLLAHCGMLPLFRDFRSFHQYLYRLGLAAPNALPQARPSTPSIADLDRSVGDEIACRLGLLWAD